MTVLVNELAKELAKERAEHEQTRRKLERVRKLAVTTQRQLNEEREKWRARKQSWVRSKRKHTAMRTKYRELLVSLATAHRAPTH